MVVEYSSMEGNLVDDIVILFDNLGWAMLEELNEIVQEQT